MIAQGPSHSTLYLLEDASHALIKLSIQISREDLPRMTKLQTRSKLIVLLGLGEKGRSSSTISGEKGEEWRYI